MQTRMITLMSSSTRQLNIISEQRNYPLHLVCNIYMLIQLEVFAFCYKTFPFYAKVSVWPPMMYVNVETR